MRDMSPSIEIPETDFEFVINNAVLEVKALQDELNYVGNRAEFEFCLWLKGVVPEDIKAMTLECVFEKFYDQAKEYITDEEYELKSYADSFNEFCFLWDEKKCKYAKGDALRIAERFAMRHTEPRPEITWENESEAGIHLAGVCYELSKRDPSGYFFMGIRDAGKIMDKCQRTGRMKLRAFCERKLLTLIKKGTQGSKGLASIYKYNKIT